jgi:polyhydroxybutyrate depolymerase
VPRTTRLRLGTAVALVVSSTVLLLSGFGTSSAASPAAGCSTPSTTDLAQGATSKLGPGNYEVKLTVDHRLRCMILYVPPGAPVTNRPLVLVYHGALDSAASTEEGTDFEAVAASTGEVVAFMQGYDDTWNDDAGTTPAAKAHVNDLAYTSASITKLERIVSFDHRRIVAAGFSNGALMVQLIGCKMANAVALIVPVEGQIPVNVARTCTPSRPVSVYEVHGTDDTAIPYGGGTFIGVGGGAITVPSAPRSAAIWASLDGCASKPVVTSPASGVQLQTYGGCRNSSIVRLRTIVRGVHQWGSNIARLISEVIPTA